MKKSIAIFLASLFTFGLCACNNGSASTSENSSSEKENVVVTKENALLYQGKTEYKVVIPENADNSITTAINELNLFFEEATGVKFDVITDRGLSYDANSKYISIGNTTLLQGAGIETDNDALFRSGYLLKSQGNSYFLTGRTEGLSDGSLYAVYDFLSEFVGYEYFAPGCYSLDKNVESIATKELDVVEIPDIAQRCLGYYSVTADNEYRQRMRFERFNDTNTWITVGHSQTDYVNPDALGTAHPDWFSADKKTICLESTEMRAYLAERLKSQIAKNPDGIVVHLGQADNGVICSCEKCLEARETLYMNYSGQQIAFLNDISDRLEGWLEENYPDREILFTGFAYGYSEVAPCVWDEDTGKYEPFSEYVRPKDNVGIYWAPIRNDYSALINDSTATVNVPSYKALQAWRNLIGDDNRIYMWSYCTNFMQYFVNFPNFNTIAGNYKIYADNGIRYIFENGPSNSGTTTFEELRIYLHSKLMWDTSLDVNKLVKNFMDNYYGVASDEMYNYYLKLNAYYAGIQKNEGFIGTVYYSVADTKYWPIGVLNSFAGILDDALVEVNSANLKASEKEEYKNRINRIYMSIKYLYMQNYRGNFTNAQIEETIAFFEKYKDMYNIFNSAEGELLDSVIEKWRV